jgi:hypothetical protein
MRRFTTGGDEAVMAGLQRAALAIARGQSGVGTCGATASPSPTAISAATGA